MVHIKYLMLLWSDCCRFHLSLSEQFFYHKILYPTSYDHRSNVLRMLLNKNISFLHEIMLTWNKMQKGNEFNILHSFPPFLSNCTSPRLARLTIQRHVCSDFRSTAQHCAYICWQSTSNNLLNIWLQGRKLFAQKLLQLLTDAQTQNLPEIPSVL